MSDSDFTAQVAAKLESISAEIDELQQLKAKLEDLQKHLGTDPQDGGAVAPPAAEVAAPDTAAAKLVTVPAARRATAATPKAKPAKKTPAKTAGSAKKTRKTTAPRGKARPKGSTRADRVLELLDEQPRTVSEMTELLTQKHPDHAAPETAVRNTLETSLVAKGLAHRSKQGRNVFYSRPVTAPKAETEANETGAADTKKEEVAPASA